MKVAIVSTHPIQYYSPWFRFLAEGQKGDGSSQMEDGGPSFAPNLADSGGASEGLNFEVFYAHKQTAKGQAEAGFGVEFEWDVPLLEGYPYRFLKNVSKRPGLDWFGGCDCPEIGEILVDEGFTHVLLIGWHKKVFWQAFWAAKKDGIKVLSRGDSQLGMTSSPLKRAIKFVAYRLLLPRFDAHLYVGRRNLEYLKHYGVRDSRLFFCPHFVDNEWWSANAERSAAGGEKPARSAKAKQAGGETSLGQGPVFGGQRREAGGSVKFLFAGKFIPKKRVMDLLEAAAGVPEARVVLVGDGPLREQLKARAEQPDLKGRVEFVGFKNQKELPAYLAAADCLVLPSDGTETWGLIVNEAMACGKPAIVSEACGCAPDLIEEGKTGFSFRCGNIQALADAMGKFCQAADQDWQTAVQNKIKKHSMAEATDGLMKALQAVSS